MIVGLMNIEPKIVNTAYMQISQYHKQLGDTVEWYNKNEYLKYDEVYCSSIFDFTDKKAVPHTSVVGGSGFGVNNRLPLDIEICNYDYSIYSECEYSIVWFSRGCIRNCPFCIVYQKEGKIHPVLPKPLNPKGKYVVIYDNNFFACPGWFDRSVPYLDRWGQKIIIQQGIDIRIINKDQCDFLNKYHWKQSHKKQIHFAWDNPADNLIPKIEFILQYIQPIHLMCYVLIGFNSTPEQDIYRVNTLKQYKIDPYVMPYNKFNSYQKNFARWVNRKAIFYKTSWEDYRKSKFTEKKDG